jgi:phospholipid-binding lipoprotein MlaA
MRIFFFLALLCSFSLVSYAEEDDFDYPGGDGSNNSQKCMDIDDPYEKLNRKIFMFNSALDHFLLRPVAKGYRNTVNEEARSKISNAASNTQVPLTMVNNLLQKEPKNALLSFWQFMVNSTFGIGGLENVAKKTGLEVQPQTFGSTLARYGVGPGPYIVLPLLGGRSARDMWDPIILNKTMNPLTYAINKKTEYAITAVKLVSDRANVLPYTDHVAETSTDPYVTIRSSIHQNREEFLRYPPYYRCKK